jgi:cold shock CspA family protein
MARSQESYNKKEVRNKKEKKRKEKEQKRIERKASPKDSNTLDDMMAYVDENGRISSTPPDITNKKKVNLEDIVISIPRRASEANRNTIRKGIVTFYNESKGFGFIRDLEDQQSVFVHVNDFVDDVREQSRVTFEVEMGHKGPKAVNVKLDK